MALMTPEQHTFFKGVVMILEKAMLYFRLNASKNIYEFSLTFQKSKPDVRTKLRVAQHYTNEADKKFEILWRIAMGNKKKNNVFGSTKFCAISLDTEGKERAKEWLKKHGKDIDTLASDMVRDGWKSSFTWDADNDCFIASSTQRDEDHDNFDICVTSRADNMWDAMMLNYYKIYVLYNKQELPTERLKNSWG